MIPHLSLFALAVFMSLFLTPTVRAAARWGGVVDLPDGRRKVHSRSIPRLGGVAIFVAFYCSLWLLAGRLDHPDIRETQRLASAMFLPSLVVLLLGAADDLWSVGPATKIAAQLVAGLLIYYHLGIRIEMLTNPFTGTSTLALLSLPATLFWIVLVTNAFNIVDGMDGLAAGVCFIALTCMFLVSLQMGNMAIALVVAPLAGAVLGFLRYNFSPASIFLGDSGSLFLGFQLAVLSIVGSQKSTTAIAVTAPLFILALPLAETAISTARRFLSGRSIVQADSGHIHHRLMRLGFTPRRAVGLLYVGSAAFGLTSLFVIRSNATAVGLIALLLAAITWVAIQRLGYSEFAELNSALNRFVNQRRIIQNGIVSRKLEDQLRVAQSADEAWVILKRAARRLGFSCLELRIRPQAGEQGMAAHQTRNYSQRLLPASANDPGSETTFSVALMGTRGELGEVVFSRPTAASPLHSELPLLISAVALGLPPLLEPRALNNQAVNAEASQRALDAVSPAQLDVSCPACGSDRLLRSRSRSSAEKIRKHLTHKRIHRCERCQWRGWILPSPQSCGEATFVKVPAPVDLNALDAAIAAIRYEPPPGVGRMMGQIAFRQAASPISSSRAPR